MQASGFPSLLNYIALTICSESANYAKIPSVNVNGSKFGDLLAKNLYLVKTRFLKFKLLIDEKYQ